VPERRHRLLQRTQRHRHVFVRVVLARVAEHVARERGRHAVEGVDEDVARIRVRHLVIAKLERRDAAADADLKTPVAEMVKNADLLREPQRRIERQQIDEWPEPDSLGRTRDRAEIDARYRHEIERRCVMLSDMQPVDAGFVGGGSELEALVEGGRDRAIGALDVIENSNFHCCLRLFKPLTYSFSSRLALPLAILALSSSQSGMLASQRGAGGCASN